MYFQFSFIFLLLTYQNCSDSVERENGSCTHISCSIENFARSQVATIVISAVLDDRFFQVSECMISIFRKLAVNYLKVQLFTIESD